MSFAFKKSWPGKNGPAPSGPRRVRPNAMSSVTKSKVAYSSDLGGARSDTAFEAIRYL